MRKLSTLVVLVMLVGVACSASPERAVRTRIDDAVALAEERALGKLRDFVSPSYHDARGHDRRELLGLVALHMRGADSRHFFVRTRSVRVTGAARAEARVMLAIADVPIANPRALERMSAELLAVDLKLAEESGEWKVTYADWRSVSLGEFLAG